MCARGSQRPSRLGDARPGCHLVIHDDNGQPDRDISDRGEGAGEVRRPAGGAEPRLVPQRPDGREQRPGLGRPAGVAERAGGEVGQAKGMVVTARSHRRATGRHGHENNAGRRRQAADGGGQRSAQGSPECQPSLLLVREQRSAHRPGVRRRRCRCHREARRRRVRTSEPERVARDLREKHGAVVTPGPGTAASRTGRRQHEVEQRGEHDLTMRDGGRCAPPAGRSVDQPG
jgi:hypothetical protein